MIVNGAHHRIARRLVAVASVGVLVGCGAFGRSSDDVARIASRTGGTRGSITSVLDGAATVSARDADELARLLANAAPPPTNAVTIAADRLSSTTGTTSSVALGVVCDVLAEGALDPTGVGLDTLAESLVGNLVATFGGDPLGWALTAESIASDIATGAAADGLWARVTLLKLQHCP